MATAASLYRRILALTEAGTPFAVLRLLRTEGSTPLPAGALAVVAADGRLWGTVGGGAPEAQARQQAVAACAGGRPKIVAVALSGVDCQGAVPVCGGALRLLVDPTAAADHATHAAVATALGQREGGVLVTRIGTAVERTWIPAARLAAGDLPGVDPAEAVVAATVWREDSPRLLHDRPGGREVFVEALRPDPRLVIAGGGHVGRALALLAVGVGFAVTVVDDRAEVLEAGPWPEDVTCVHGPLAATVAGQTGEPDTYVVIVTRGHREDAAVLESCCHRPLSYVGMIGSRRKVGMLRRDLLVGGRVPAADFDRVHAPIGLPIGAVTAEEIAVSILAELIAVRRGAGA